MKRFLSILFISTIVYTNYAMAWGKLGHEVIVEIAKRHITEKSKHNIAKYMPYDITKDAIWMDIHRHDKEIGYTTSWHVYNIDEEHEYDMNPRLYKGDAILAMKVIEHNLTKQERLTDSAIVMNIRMLIHFVGDIHCPTHSYVPGPRCFWPCELNGKKIETFHGLYDNMPMLLHPKKSSIEIASEIDNAKKSEIKRIQRGDYHEWAHEIGSRNAIIYKWNPHNTKSLNPDTVELSRDLVNLQMRNAGYRLAYLLNRYFDR
uniref:S1/P1 nuclease n=1 Tax=Alistipes sp. TaxID=1872444 RepID=UPI004055D5F4